MLSAFATSPAFRELSGTLYRETFWLVSDHLGTPRMVADKTGSLAGVKRHDYLPFGEELYADTGGRATQQGYGAADNVRQQFTGYERDNETKLDYAEARYYSSTQGRFTSVDPLMRSARIGSPQTFNRYSYSLNNPLRFTDPSGQQANEKGKGLPDPCKAHRCQTDDQGSTIYIDENTGDTIYVTNAKDDAKKGEPAFVFPVAGFLGPTTLADPLVSNPAPSVARRVAGAIGGAVGNFFGAIVIILTNPIETGGGCQPGVCGVAVDRSANPDPEANKPDTSENRSAELTYIPPPKSLPGFPGAKKVRSKSQRARWKDDDGNIYEWDSQHGRVEKYDKRGRHLGEFDHNTGAQTKPADPNRRIEP